MEPRIVKKDVMAVVGMVFYGNPFEEAEGWSQENQIGRLWGEV